MAQTPKIAIDGDDKSRGAQPEKGERGTIRQSGRKLQKNVRSAIRISIIASRDEGGNAITLHSDPGVTTGDPLVLV